MLSTILSIAAVLAAQQTSQLRAAPVGCPANVALARLVRESEAILVATPRVPAKRLKAAMLKSSPDYIDIPLDQPSNLKGEADRGPLILKVYPKRTTYMPSPERLLALSGKPALLFVTHVDQGPIGLYFQQFPEALQDATPKETSAVRAEIARQGSRSTAWRADASVPHFDDVRILLTQLPTATRDQQTQIFGKLESFGAAGAPAIIAQMDDRRPLTHREIALENHDPKAFESLRHYGPKLVVDALDAILNQITGYGASIVNGGSERQRRSTVASWRAYAADLNCNLD